jgi:NAD(P)-dependent dehydrogenase (short-subunit alcohol dehydrogenase family)
MTDLDGKVAVVVGASAEGGTGWGISQGLAARGAKVVVAARSFEPLERLAAHIGGTAVRCDAGDENDIRALKDRVLSKYGKLDIAVNSAATPTLGFIADASTPLLQQGVQVNYFGMAFFVRYMAEAMSGPGSIVLISSMSTTHPIFPHFAYACGKAAMECLVRYAALEYGPRQIRVNGIRIATVMSDMAKDHYNTPGVGDRFIQEIPLGRLGQPDDMANATAWLSGPSYITGSILDISGGNQLTRFPFLDELPGQGASYEGSGALYDREHGRGTSFSGSS